MKLRLMRWLNNLYLVWVRRMKCDSSAKEYIGGRSIMGHPPIVSLYKSTTFGKLLL